jgi:hypothetical protein
VPGWRSTTSKALTPNPRRIWKASSFRQSYYRYDRPRTNIDIAFQYYPSLSNWGRHRIQLAPAVKREVLKDVFISVNMFDTFDSRPPSESADRNDVGIVLSFGWSY